MVKSVIVCGYCKTMYKVGEVHSCAINLIDLDGTKKLRKAIVKIKATWVPKQPTEKGNDGR